MKRGAPNVWRAMKSSVALAAAVACALLSVLVIVGAATVGVRAFDLGDGDTHHTVHSRLESLAPAARERMRPHFEAAGVAYPPRHVALVGLKREKKLLLYAGASRDAMAHVHTYPIRRASGGLGPKLREGDRQVPEGIYGVDLLNPNSRYRVSVRIDYPNRADRRQARKDGREVLGGWIMIHGGASSIGCLAMGDPASEEIFTLVADAGRENVQVILAPTDLRRRRLPARARRQPAWMQVRYDEIGRALATLPLPSQR